MATSLLPENWSSGLRSCDWPKLFVPRVERGADPEAEQLPARLRVLAPLLQRVVADEVERDVEAPRVVARVVDAAVGRLVGHLLGLDVVALAHLDRVEIQLVGHDVDHALREPELLHARVAAVRSRRRLVRAGLREVHAHVAPAVAARRHLRPDDAAERLVAREGAGVVERLDLEAEHRAVGLHRHLDVEERALVAVRVRRVLVRAPLRPLHGPVELPRQQAEGDEVRVQRDLVAEPAADVLRDDAELVGADAQRRGHPDDPDPRHLVVAVQRPLGRAAVVLDERAGALQRRGGEAMEIEAVDLDDVVGLGQRLVEVAPLEGPRPDDVRAGFVMEDGRAGLDRCDRVEDRLERLVLDLDQLGGVARQLARLGDDGGHGLAREADLADCERVVADLAPRRRRHLEERIRLRRDLLADQRPVHALDRLGLGDVDGHDPGVGVRRADEVDVAHAVALDVVEEDALALYEALVLLARDARAGEALLRGLDLVGGDGRHAGTSPRAAASIASTMFT